jgi:aminoglycoside phosphotransferase (APT) family kinase protein
MTSSTPAPTAVEAVTAVLEAHLGEGTRVTGLRRLAGGGSHDTWAFDAVDTSGSITALVLRRAVDASDLRSEVRSEGALLAGLHELGIAVPRPHSEAPGLVLLERVPGEDLRKALARDVVDDRPALGRSIAEAQAAIHAVDPNRLDGGLDTGTDDPIGREIARWADLVAHDDEDPSPLLRAAAGWLAANQPAATEQRLVHGDLKANNLLVRGGQLTAVLDWELVHVGDPHADLAWTLLWTTDADIVNGLLGAEDYLAAYEAASGRRVDRDVLRFWELHALVKLAAILRIQGGLGQGGPGGPMLAMLGRAVTDVERRVAGRLIAALDGGAP